MELIVISQNLRLIDMSSAFELSSANDNLDSHLLECHCKSSYFQQSGEI